MEEETMEEEKKKNNVVLIVLVVLLGLACLGMGAYIFMDKNQDKTTKSSITDTKVKEEQNNDTSDDSATKDNSTKDNAKNNVNTQNTQNTVLFDSSKSLNTTGNTYSLHCSGPAGIFVSVNADPKEMTFNFTPSRVVEYYPLNWSSSRTDVSSSVIRFDKKIVDLFFGGMGQDVTSDTLFILLEDGTVEYIPLVHMFQHAQDAPLSYGKVPGVSGVTKFIMSNVTSGYTGWVTTLAIRSDGSFYDMSEALKNTGNY